MHCCHVSVLQIYCLKSTRVKHTHTAQLLPLATLLWLQEHLSSPMNPAWFLGISHPITAASDSASAKPHTPIHSRQPLSLYLGWPLGGNPTERR